jgi:signal peptidase I
MNASEPAVLSRRSRRWLAAILSLLAPGIGQLYAGEPLRAFRLIAAFALVVIAAAYGLLILPPTIAAPAVWILMIGFQIYAAVDAWRIVSTSMVGDARPLTRWFVVLPAFAVVVTLGRLLNVFRKVHLVEAYTVPGVSMEPTVLPGDYVVVDKRGSARRPERDAVVVAENSRYESGLIVRRTIGLPGDTLEMRPGMLWRNGQRVPLPEGVAGGPLGHFDSAQRDVARAWQLPHLIRAGDAGYTPDVDDWGPLVVPADSFFSLGDNRRDSYDGRYYGFDPITSIVGRLRYVYLSRQPGGGFRSGRTGRTIQ